MYIYTWLVRSSDVPGADFGCALYSAYAVAVGAVGQILVAVCSVCAGVICVDVIKRRIAVCTYAWISYPYGV